MGGEMKKVKTCYVYARTSKDDADILRGKARAIEGKVNNLRKGYSIEDQIKVCEAKCQALGLTLLHTPFVDRGISGRMYPAGYGSVDDSDCEEYYKEKIKPKKKYRPAFGRLLDAPPSNFLIVRDLSRIVRPYKDSFVAKRIWQLLRARNISIITIEEGDINLEKFEDRLLRDLRMQVEDQIKQKEAERSYNVLQSNKDSGYLATGVKCLGYTSKIRSPGSKENPSVIPIENELALVRIIFDKYLAKMKLLQITRHLNDDLNKRTKNGNLWTVNQVRKVLLRPWYAGLQYNSNKEIIDSKVFAPHAIVNRIEFDRVKSEFNIRERKKAYKDPSTPGPAIGTQYSNGICHPFSSLIRCGICNRPMQPQNIHNKYYSEKIVVETFHYVCNTYHLTKDIKFDACRRSRIKEEYPQKSLELGITPNGNGLIEALFPLLFYGVIEQYVEQLSITPELFSKRQQLQLQLDQITEQEESYFSKLENKILNEDQFALGMKRMRDQRAKINKALAEIEQTLQSLESATIVVPDKLFLDPKQISRETMQELAHATFESILIYGDKITVILKRINPITKQHYSFDIERIRNRNSRDLPFCTAVINSDVLTANSKIGITYFYPSTKIGIYNAPDIKYHDSHIEVRTIGENISIDKVRNENIPKKCKLNNHFMEKIGPPPGYGRSLTVSSNVFYGSLMARTLTPKELKAELSGS